MKLKSNKVYNIYNQQRKIKGKNFITEVLNEAINNEECAGINIYTDCLELVYNIYCSSYNFYKYYDTFCVAEPAIFRIGKKVNYNVKISWQNRNKTCLKISYNLVGLDILKLFQKLNLEDKIISYELKNDLFILQTKKQKIIVDITTISDKTIDEIEIFRNYKIDKQRSELILNGKTK